MALIIYCNSLTFQPEREAHPQHRAALLQQPQPRGRPDAALHVHLLLHDVAQQVGAGELPEEEPLPQRQGGYLSGGQ